MAHCRSLNLEPAAAGATPTVSTGFGDRLGSSDVMSPASARRLASRARTASQAPVELRFTSRATRTRQGVSPPRFLAGGARFRGFLRVMGRTMARTSAAQHLGDAAREGQSGTVTEW